MRIKTIKGYEGLYEVSDAGKIFSCERIKIRMHNGVKYESLYKRRELKLQKNRNGYICAMLCKNDGQKLCTVHRLVAIAFVLNPLFLPLVMHKDNDKANNNYSNLKWGTYSMNLKQSYDDETRSKKGEKHQFAKVTDEIVRRIRKSSLSLRELGRIYDINASTVGYIKRRDTWKHI
jgi:hypothetical protein